MDSFVVFNEAVASLDLKAVIVVGVEVAECVFDRVIFDPLITRAIFSVRLSTGKAKRQHTHTHTDARARGRMEMNLMKFFPLNFAGSYCILVAHSYK